MITFKNSQIRLLGYFLLLTSIIIFLLTWLQWYVSIPSTALLLYAFQKLSRNLKEDRREFSISKGTILLIIFLVLGWVLISGVGGAFPQKDDMHWRNAILHDLINYQWPVRYADGFDSSLTYYIAFWMIPAMLGKAAAFLFSAQVGWLVANIAVATYCTIIITVVILLLLSHLNATSTKRAILIISILFVFSGMDIIPAIVSQLGNHNFSIGTRLEWWTYIEYSATTTQLGWVVNQAIPTWLVISLLLHETRMNHFAFLGLLLLPYGPLPFVGIFVLMVTEAFIKLVEAAKTKELGKWGKQIISTPNIVAIVIIFPIYFFYYHSNATASGKGAGWNHTEIFAYLFFVFIEFLFVLILVWRHSFHKPYFIPSAVCLFLIPFVTFGSGQDFCMRVSIPMLFILMVNVMDYLLHNTEWHKNKKLSINSRAIPLIVLLMIGAFTPLNEYRESYIQIKQSESHCTSIYADNIGTLENGQMERDNFITKNASETFFYRYLAKGEK